MPRPSIRFRPIGRIALAVAALVLLVMVPFAFFGEVMDGAAQGWMADAGRPAIVALIGVVLLTVDVLLPIPASLVSLGLCWVLGPVWGGLCVLIGHVLAFALGYGLGASLPRRRLRRFIGADAWDRLVVHMDRRAWIWIGLSRPLPVLSEVVTVSAGALRLPLGAVLPAALLSSMGVAVVYGSIAHWGMRQPSPAMAVAGSLVLPALFFLLSAIARGARPFRHERNPERGVS